MERFRLGLIADDLTGALDTGVQFQQKGLTTVVPFKYGRSFQDMGVVAFNSNTRHEKREVAFRRVFQLTRRLKGRILFKKVDSTLRGNVAAEIMAMLEASGLHKAILAPAFPTQGRTLEEGILKFYGTPFHRTAYREAFSPPLDTSFVPELMERGLGEKVGHLGREALKHGPLKLSERIRGARERVILVDSWNRRDLRLIGQAWWSFLRDEALICGSAGLAKEIDLGEPPRRTTPFRMRRKKGPLLLVSGSRHEKTLNQVRRVLKVLGFPLVEPDMADFTNPLKSAQEIRKVARLVGDALDRSKGVVLSTSFREMVKGNEDQVAQSLGKVVGHVLRRHEISSLILSGGDVAMEVCQNLRSGGMRIETEILQGIPLSSLLDGPWKGLPIVTKGGGLGDPNAFLEVIHYLTG